MKLLIDVNTTKFEEDETGAIFSNVQILKTGKFNHPYIGFFEVAKSTMKEMKKNFDDKIRGVELAVDYHHQNQQGAAGWFREIFLNETKKELWAKIEWTSEGKTFIEDKVFRYFSPEFRFEWQDEETGKGYRNVLFGGALTNRPFLKNMAPISLSEISENQTTKEVEEMKIKVKREGKIVEIDEVNLQEGDEKVVEKTPEELATEKKAADEKVEAEKIEAEKKAADEKKLAEEKAAKEGIKAEEVKLEERVLKLEDQNKKLEERNGKLEGTISLKERTEEYNKLLKEGKINPKQKDAFIKRDFDSFVKLSMPIIDYAEAGETKGENEPLTLEEKKMIKKLNITEEDYKKYGKQNDKQKGG